MPYSKLLTQIIDKSGLTIKEIAGRCKQSNVNITPAYISILKNSDEKTPSDEVSRALAIACGAEHKEALVVEAYLDKAPQEILNFLEEYRKMVMQSLLFTFTNQFSSDEISIAMNNLKEMPIAEFLLTINTVMPTMDFEKRLESAKITRQEDNAFMEITKPIGYKVEDNSMFPILQQGSIVNLEIKEEYSNGDILCFAKKKGKGVFFRKGFFANEKRTKLNLIAVNDNISVTVDIKDIEIIGRVKTIITEIE